MKPSRGERSLKTYLSERREAVDAALERFLPSASAPTPKLLEAMRYSVFSGGKRLRPILALTAYELTGGEGDAVLAPACATELIHTYSLIHDDLPAMDDDNTRRGRATCHRAFDEATAILAGDALLTSTSSTSRTAPPWPSSRPPTVWAAWWAARSLTLRVRERRSLSRR